MRGLFVCFLFDCILCMYICMYNVCMYVQYVVVAKDAMKPHVIEPQANRVRELVHPCYALMRISYHRIGKYVNKYINKYINKYTNILTKDPENTDL